MRYAVSQGMLYEIGENALMRNCIRQAKAGRGRKSVKTKKPNTKNALTAKQ